jgi:hypothetical protein
MMTGARKHTLALRDPEHHVRMCDSTSAYVYVLQCRYEDILKVGFSRDPLGRMQTLHPRYFEFFDLERALVVATESVGDARALESELFEAAALHRAPGPLAVCQGAGGHTEWFRGAYSLVQDAAVGKAASAGYTLHSPALNWLRARLQLRAEGLYESTTHMLRMIDAGHACCEPAAAVAAQLRNLLDSYAAMELDVECRVPAGVLAWYRRGVLGDT